MVKQGKRKPLDDLVDEKFKKFQSGLERKRDDDLDQEIWRDGGYENMEPLPGEDGEFAEPPPIEEELEEILDERGIPEFAAPIRKEKSLLRIEFSGRDCEIVCGYVPAQTKNLVEKYCRKKNLEIEDVWYNRKLMRDIIGELPPAWFQIDEVFHLLGLAGDDLGAFSIAGLLDYERLEELEPENFRIIRSERESPPKEKRGMKAVVAGMINDGKYSYELEIEGDFDSSKLELVLLDLSGFGLKEPLLAEVRYGGEAMYYEHDDYIQREMMDVTFL